MRARGAVWMDGETHAILVSVLAVLAEQLPRLAQRAILACGGGTRATVGRDGPRDERPQVVYFHGPGSAAGRIQCTRHRKHLHYEVVRTSKQLCKPPEGWSCRSPSPCSSGSMVTIHDLYSLDFPELPGLRASLSAADAGATLEILAAGTGSRSASRSRASASTATPHLGPSAELVPFSREELEAKCQAVRDARERACEHLRLELQRRTSSRASSGRASCRSRQESSVVADYQSVPAAFPFPEPIPHEAPARRPVSRQRTGSPSYAGSWTSASSRVQGHEDSMLAKSDHVPAVFPFPEPIPQGPPAKNLVRPSLHGCTPRASSSMSAAKTPQQLSSTREEFTSRKEACSTDDFVWENKQRANEWISKFTPHTWLLEQERPYFVRMKLEEERRRKNMASMYQKMPTLPFDLWCEVQVRPEGDGVDGTAKPASPRIAQANRALLEQRLLSRRKMGFH